MEKRSTLQVLDSDRLLLKEHSQGIPTLWLIHALIQAFVANPSIVDPYLSKVGYCRPTDKRKKIKMSPRLPIAADGEAIAS